MSTYEKIFLVLIGILLAFLLFFSYHEIKEPSDQGGRTRTESDFDKSLGQDFKIGPYTIVVSEQSSGGQENNCAPLQPVIIATLHDIEEHLELLEHSAPTEYAFEVNQQTLQLFCNKNAEIVLADTGGNKLLLQKIPFVRNIPPQSGASDIGTEVRINATLVPLGSATPGQPTTFGDILIPDRYLDTATSSPM